MVSRLNDVELLSRLVSHDTTSSRPSAALASFVEGYLREGGAGVRTWEYAPGKVNLLAWAGPAPGDDSRDSAAVREGVLLSGHFDVVPAVEPEWTTDPFTLTERGDYLAGRGAVDMKGFAAAAINLVRDCAREQPRRTVAVLMTSDEEVGSLGAQAFLRGWRREDPLPRSAVVGEPTSLKVVRMHKGHLKVRVTVKGVASHSGMPHLGRSAIEPAARIVTAFGRLRESMESERVETSVHFPETPFPTLNVGVIRGGEAVNVVPDRCVIDVGVRLLPGMRSAPMVDRLRAAAAEGAAGLAADAWSFELVNDSPPMLLREDAAVNRELGALVGQRETRSVSFASDAGTLQSLGLECALFGPGDMALAHRPNEAVERGELERTGPILERFVRARCGV